MRDLLVRTVDLNTIILAGNVIGDPKLIETSESVLCKFRMVNNRTITNKSGEKKERSVFIDVIVWGNQGEYVHKRLRKGHPVIVTGSLSENTKNGVLEIVASKVHIQVKKESIEAEDKELGYDFGDYGAEGTEVVDDNVN